MFYLPLTSNPVGWVILGLGSYALYKAGKKKGEEESAAAMITEVPESDNTEKESNTEKTK